jgi:hypothetical protein
MAFSVTNPIFQYFSIMLENTKGTWIFEDGNIVIGIRSFVVMKGFAGFGFSRRANCYRFPGIWWGFPNPRVYAFKVGWRGLFKNGHQVGLLDSED